MAQQALLAELHALRDNVTGVLESAIATVDGLLMVADTDGARPEVVSALAAASLGLGKRTGMEVGMGELREVVIRCRSGYISIYAVGHLALLAVLADEGLDVARLHIESRSTVERIAVLVSEERRSA
ncbi:roadblock/LC7 domain-containing protein [Streptosporangiaceae bacterium NEAU-GS5]|nr:roadblock/LC7 domain-containing protein [Streptosporangiaceae bacterium NEAU-GS5]